jgi:dipeptidyl aminopeptidase/acylaminoacyl peptidase
LVTRRTSRLATRARAATDPYGIGPSRTLIAPALAGVGLAVIALITLALFTGSVPVPAGGSGPGGGNNGGAVGPIRTPAPSNVVIVDPRTNIPGTLVFVKQGNLWTQTGNKAVQITTSGAGSMPSWSPDGQWIYYIESVHDPGGYFPGGGEAPNRYSMDYPVLTRVHPDGSGAEKLLSGRYKQGSYTWFFWIRQPRVSPDGRTVVIASDGPDPTKSDVVLQTYDVKTDKTRRLNLPENPPLGHQDPAWRPDGKLLLFVRNGRDGTRGAPTIYRYDPATKKSVALSAPGYMQPSWSPDGRWVAVTKTSTLGTDVAILDARNGSEVLRLTSDGRSWGPVWSPKGDSIAYMHIEGLIVDLKMIGLSGSGPAWTAEQLPDVTQYSGLDGGSGASWYIPADQLPPPASSPAPASSPGGSAAP